MFKHQFIFIILILLIIISFFTALMLGAAHVSIFEIFEVIENKILFTSKQTPFDVIIWDIRLPRLFNAFLAGGILAISGAAMQAIFKNPLADPSIIGISSGASLFASLAIYLSGTILFKLNIVGLSLLSLFTFIGAIFTTLIIIAIAYKHKKTDVPTMLMAGIAINALCGALIGIIIFASNDAQLRSITFWSLGSLGGSVWNQVIILCIVLVFNLLILIPHFKDLNAFSLGDENAYLLGVNSENLKRKIVLTTSLGVGTTVAFFGIIGFVGLVVPHIIRLISGADNRMVLPASAMGGAILLSLADTISRTFAAPAELPIGIITAITGAPLFLYILINHKKSNAFSK